MWTGVLWAGLRVAMWITHVGGKFRHCPLEESLRHLRIQMRSKSSPKTRVKNQVLEKSWSSFFCPKDIPKTVRIVNLPSVANLLRVAIHYWKCSESLHLQYWSTIFWVVSSESLCIANFLPENCGEVHPETVPFQSLCCAPCSTEQSTFRRGGEGRKGAEKRRGRGVASKGGNQEKRTRENKSDYRVVNLLRNRTPYKNSMERSFGCA